MATKHYWIVRDGMIRDVGKLTYTHIDFASTYFKVDYKIAYETAFENGWIRITVQDADFNISCNKKNYTKIAAQSALKLFGPFKSSVDMIVLEFLDTKEEKIYRDNKAASEFIADLQLMIDGEVNKMNVRKQGSDFIRLADFL